MLPRNPMTPIERRYADDAREALAGNQQGWTARELAEYSTGQADGIQHHEALAYYNDDEWMAGIGLVSGAASEHGRVGCWYRDRETERRLRNYPAPSRCA